MTAVAIAVDLGGTKVEAALVDADGRLVPGSRHRRPTGAAASAEAIAAAVRGCIVEVLAAIRPEHRVIGTGIGAAGPVDLGRGTVSPLNLPAWRDHPLRDQVTDLVADAAPGLPVVLAIDGLCITLAEHWRGAAVGRDNVIGMVVSTGIGGGLLLDGRPATGKSGNAGHIGHLEVSGFDDPCACGGRGCLEAVASGPASVAWARREGWRGSSGEELGRDFASGHPVARATVERAGRALGRAIASAVSLVDVDMVAIGGGFSRVAPELFDHIRIEVAERERFAFVTAVRIVPSGLTDEGPLIGAAALVHRGGALR